MALNPNIILSGQQFDLMGAMNSGMAAAQNQNALTRQRQIEDLYRTQGNALMQGDTNALGMLAQFDPMAAQGMLANKQQMDIQRTTAQREAERYVKEVGAEKAAADAAQARQEAMYGMSAPDPATFDARMVEIGRPDLVGQFQNRQTLAMPFMEFADAVEMITPKVVDPTKGAPTGYKFTDPANPGAGVEMLPGYVPKAAVEVNMGGDAGEYLYGTDGGVPAGWRVHKQTGVASQIPGGPAAMEAAGQEAAAANAAGAETVATDTITTAAARAREAAGNRQLGGFGASIVANNPYSDSAEVERQIDVLRANAATTTLQAMREASPTGATGFGALTAPEMKVIQDKAGALNQDSPTFLRDLEDYERTLLRVIHGPEAGDRIFEATRQKTTTGGVPEGVDPADWEYMTPEERALFQ